jgi:hypothetical protein
MYLCSLAVVVESNVTSVAAGELTSMRHITSHPMVGGSLSPQHGASLGCGWRNGLQLWRVAANILKKAAVDKRKEVVLQLGCRVWG